MELSSGEYKLSGVTQVSVVLGKNGCGKSTLLKAVESSMPPDAGSAKYVTPERGGTLTYEASVEQQTLNDVNWLAQTRRVNQFNNFKQQTVAQYRALETSVLRLMEAAMTEGRGDEVHGFQETVDRINALLDNIEIRRAAGSILELRRKSDNLLLHAHQISSGESELIALAIECLAFAYQVVPGGRNVLFLDEPDVHLHPDLQARLTRFLVELVSQRDFTIIMATHSTAMLGELSGYGGGSVAFMRAGETSLQFLPIGAALQQVLPVFGAHPLSSIFNASPVLIVEGEDDVRIWQQAVRSSAGRIAIYPVECGGISNMPEFENVVRDIAGAVYDNARAFSLRDGDDNPGDLEDVGAVTRLRLHCRAAENLMLADESLERAGVNWATVTSRLDEWISNSSHHPRHADLRAFAERGYDRRHANLKEIRMVVAAEGLAISRPWEVHVGQTLGALASGSVATTGSADSVVNYLGTRVSQHLLQLI